MRLRLQIQRQDLPTVNTLWPLSDQQLKQPVSHLLVLINNTFPLETDKWGLEDYVVQIGGYECLHYHEIASVCKDDEEVLIRPLQYAEIRRRALLRRTQIHTNGMHLIDGVAFGRPLVRSAPIRPEGVRIPPRKKVRIDMGNEEDDEDINGIYGPGRSLEQKISRDEGQLVRWKDDNEDDAEAQHPHLIEFGDAEMDDSEEDEDFEQGASDSGEDISSASDPSIAQHNSGSDAGSDDDSSNSTDDTSSDDDDESSVSDSDGDSEVNVGPHLGTCEAQNETVTKTLPAANQEQVANTDRTSTKSAASKNKNPKAGAAALSISNAPPGEGKDATQKRNKRRRDSKKLAFLKAAGHLPQEASLEDLRKWNSSGDVEHLVNGTAQHIEHNAVDQSMVIERATYGNANSVTTDSTSTKTLGYEPDAEAQHGPQSVRSAKSKAKTNQAHSADFERRRQALLDELAKSGVDLRDPAVSTHVNDKPEEMSSKDPNNTQNGIAAAHVPEPTIGSSTSTALVPPSVSGRKKLDLARSKRFLFGSLGVRVPNTQEERENVEKKLNEQIRPKSKNDSSQKATDSVAQDEEEDGPSPNGWRKRIVLNAVECCEEGVELSTPPFPFYQRWDVQQQGWHKRKKSKSSKYMSNKRKRTSSSGDSQHFEVYDKYNTDGYGDELDYDDTGANEEDENYAEDDYWEEGALLNNGFEDEEEYQNGHYGQADDEDDFPPLPSDTASLPIIGPNEVNKGDFIIFCEITVSAATNWSPAPVMRTAQVLNIVHISKAGEEDTTKCTLKLAMRDLRPREYDEDGKRVYRKFEMEGFSDEEEGGSVDEHEEIERERTRVVDWGELAKVRMLQKCTIDGVKEQEVINVSQTD